jgi:lipoprotein-releasing system permease protein
VTSHATATGLDRVLPEWQSFAALAQSAREPGQVMAAPYVEEQAMLSAKGRTLALRLRGVRAADEQLRGVDSLLAAPRLQSGTPALDGFAAGSFRIYLGAELARELDVRVGDTVIAIAPLVTATPAGPAARMRRFTVAGTFASGMYEYDRGLALTEIRDAARFFQLGDGVTGVRLTMDNPALAPQTVRAIARQHVDRHGGTLVVSDWTQSHANLFRSIALTKNLLFLILLLIVAVAAFNLVASLVMIVRDKQADIAILRTLGAAPRNVLGVFVLLGSLIGGVGIAGGAALGVLGAWNTESVVRWLGRVNGAPLVDARVYLMSDLPADVAGADVLRVCLAALLLCAVATLYPAWRAARTVPAEVLRHD